MRQSDPSKINKITADIPMAEKQNLAFYEKFKLNKAEEKTSAEIINFIKKRTSDLQNRMNETFNYEETDELREKINELNLEQNYIKFPEAIGEVEIKKILLRLDNYKNELNDRLKIEAKNLQVDKTRATIKARIPRINNQSLALIRRVPQGG